MAAVPTKPIRLIVPFPVGGAADNVTRIVARGLSDGLGQQIIVENKPGGDGVIAGSALLQSAPDGYTLLMGTASGMNAVPAMRKSPPYDPLADFTAVSLLGNFAHLLVVHPDVPAQTLPEFVAYARANPGKLREPAVASRQCPEKVGNARRSPHAAAVASQYFCLRERISFERSREAIARSSAHVSGMGSMPISSRSAAFQRRSSTIACTL